MKKHLLLFGSIVLMTLFIAACSPKTVKACLRRSNWNSNKEELFLLRAFQLDSSNTEVLNRLGWLYANHPSYTEQSRNYFFKSIQIDSTQSVAWFVIGYTYLTDSRGDETGEKEKYYLTAISYLGRAIDLDSTQSSYFYQRAYCYYELGDFPAALRDFTSCCETGNEHACLMVRKDSTGKYVDDVFNVE